MGPVGKLVTEKGREWERDRARERESARERELGRGSQPGTMGANCKDRPLQNTGGMLGGRKA